ncbi:MAG: histidinol-phosphatase [Gemmatimonadota bacterium]
MVLGFAPVPDPDPAPANWYKGNLHTHSLWTDGTDFPEMIADWYRTHGYQFLAFTEHDMLQGGEKWVDINAQDQGWPPRNKSARAALAGYRERFGGGWVQERIDGAQHLVRLRGLSEYRHLFERPDSFLLLMGEEVTDRGGAHLNAFNLEAAVLPRGGATSAQRIRNNLAAVAEQQAKQAGPIVAVVNHPNFVWTLRAEHIAGIDAARLFEVYNGHALTNSRGDSVHIGTERMWDIILAARHSSGGAPIYGVATDDAHDYRAYGDTISRPGRGWVMVRAARLAADEPVRTLAAGDFYASTGVTLRDLVIDDDGIRVEIEPEAGVTYRTQFIGTRRGSEQAGEVLAEVAGTSSQYRFRGDERYVRAKIVSSRAQRDAIDGRELAPHQAAWLQPVFR